MGLQDNNKRYTAEDFGRYHSGQMSEGEMHDLERAALEDQFLADALEGYAYSDSALEDTKQLRQKIIARKRRGKFFFMEKKGWLRIAIIFLFVVIAGYLTYQLNFNRTDKNIAQNKNAPVPNDKLRTFKKDSITVQPTNDTVQTSMATTGQVGINNPVSKAQHTNIEDLKEHYSVTLHDSERNLAKVYKTEPVSRLNVKENKADHFNKALANGVSDDKKITRSSDSSILAAVSRIDSLRLAKEGYANRKNMQENKSGELAEKGREIVALDATKSSAAMSKKLEQSANSNAAGPSDELLKPEDLPTPILGWQKFRQYILENIRNITSENNIINTGQVILSFSINKRGHPINVTIEQSLCEACDKEAASLLLNGPKWKYIKGRRGVVTIIFN